jgi:hypothetical protein
MDFNEGRKAWVNVKIFRAQLSFDFVSFTKKVMCSLCF